MKGMPGMGNFKVSATATNDPFLHIYISIALSAQPFGYFCIVRLSLSTALIGFKRNMNAMNQRQYTKVVSREVVTAEKNRNAV